MEITLGSTTAVLQGDRAVFLPASRTLVIADLHLGKSATFRARGLPVPEGSTSADLTRLGILVAKTRAQTLIVAGDLIHSHDGLTSPVLDSLRLWLAKISIPVILTEGNHDQRSLPLLQKLPLQIHAQCLINGLLITHDPAGLPPDQPGIAGHLHPGIRVRETRNSSLRLSGFHLRNQHHLILPAFSEFTGLQLIKPGPHDRFFTSLNDSVSEIPVHLAR